VATAHANVNYDELATWSQLIVDTRNAIPNPDPAKVIKA
jgi:UDP-N-acetyl-D-mannosaminuronate dehydrogenase